MYYFISLLLILQFHCSETQDFSITLNGVPIFTDSLPFDQLLGMLEDPENPEEGKDRKAIDTTYTLHFRNSIFTYCKHIYIYVVIYSFYYSIKEKYGFAAKKRIK